MGSPEVVAELVRRGVESGLRGPDGGGGMNAVVASGGREGVTDE